MGFPKTLQEFQAAFPDEEACWNRLRRARWPEGFVCPRTRLPLLSWFWAIFFLARHKNGISALQLQRDTGIGS